MALDTPSNLNTFPSDATAVPRTPTLPVPASGSIRLPPRQYRREATTRVETLTADSTERIASANEPATRLGGKSTNRPRGNRGRALGKREQLMIITQLSIMMRSGVDLADAVRSVHTRSKNAAIQEAMGIVYSSLESGQSLSAAIESERHRFGGVMVASVSAGEASGRLPDVLARLSTILRNELRLQNGLKSAISYPLVLVLVTALVLSAMIFFVLPQFSSIYESSQAPTPALTRMLLDFAEAMREFWWLLAISAGLLVGGFVTLVRSPWGKLQVDRLILQLPILSGVWRPLLTGRVFRLQGAMLLSGVPMLEVLQLTRDTTRNSVVKQLIDQVEIAVMRGEGMSTTLAASPYMPEGAAEMIATAEANGQLGEVLETVGDFFEAEGEQLLRDAVKIAEPAIIVVLGLIVGCIVLAIMLPLLDLSAASNHR